LAIPLTSARTASTSSGSPSGFCAVTSATRVPMKFVISPTCHSARRDNDWPSARVPDTSISEVMTPSSTRRPMVRNACTSPRVYITASVSSPCAKPMATHSLVARSSGTPASSAAWYRLNRRRPPSRVRSSSSWMPIRNCSSSALYVGRPISGAESSVSAVTAPYARSVRRTQPCARRRRGPSRAVAR